MDYTKTDTCQSYDHKRTYLLKPGDKVVLKRISPCSDSAEYISDKSIKRINSNIDKFFPKERSQILHIGVITKVTRLCHSSCQAWGAVRFNVFWGSNCDHESSLYPEQLLKVVDLDLNN